jgi:SAM-dependent methyltransferase
VKPARLSGPLELPGDGENLLDLVDIRTERGGAGSRRRVGARSPEIARQTAGANRIIDVDISPYLLREAEALAKQAGLADQISFEEGHAEAIPLADSRVDVALSFTVMEEGDADWMLSELVRVTRPGGTHRRHRAFARHAAMDKCSAEPSRLRQGGHTWQGRRRPGRLRGREPISALPSSGARWVNLLFAIGFSRCVPGLSDR